ncbi:hypothetical protein H490_0111610 [Leucobacter sp. UCD-THU]|nr:hypothetical protein H490_0111610 [Leucobacter sp. UCD-THU]
MRFADAVRKLLVLGVFSRFETHADECDIERSDQVVFSCAFVPKTKDDTTEIGVEMLKMFFIWAFIRGRKPKPPRICLVEHL